MAASHTQREVDTVYALVAVGGEGALSYDTNQKDIFGTKGSRNGCEIDGLCRYTMVFDKIRKEKR